MNLKTQIKPAGCFEKFEDYLDQFSKPTEKMEVDNRLSCFISKPNPDFVKVKKNLQGYVVNIKREVTLFFDNYEELCIFGDAITDGISKLRDIDKEIESRREMKILEDESDGEE